ncbi:MAG: transcription factor S [Candidatus Atabeyarchaeum deiterrae]
MVKFCPKCGAMLIPTKKGLDCLLTCRKCGHAEKDSDVGSSYVLREKIAHTARDKIVVFEGDNREANTMPTAKVDCPKCHNNLAAYWQVQTRAADEGATIFFRCLKCNHTWREY